MATTPVRGWDNPPAIAPRGTLIIVPGRGEHPGVYERFGTRLAFDGYRVRAVDDPTVDETATLKQIDALLGDGGLPGPRVLVGSDAGALFAASLAAAGQVRADALILAGYFTSARAYPAAGADWEAEISARTACPTHRARLADDARLRRGALAGPPPKAWFDTADLSRVDAPILGVHGVDDEISPLAQVRVAYAGAARSELVTIAGGKHDVLNDLTHRTVAATVVLFLERLRLSPELPVIARAERTSEA